MALPCDICHAPTSKYKCPTCTLRSCSLACYKSHTPTHTTSEAAASSSKPPSQSQPRDRPGTTNRIPKIDFKGFENDPELKRLLSRYPLLRLQLQATYALTLEPSPDEARSWSWQPLPGEAVPTAKSSYQHFRGRGRGRGPAGRGGRGARAGSQMSRGSDRQHGAWTREKGDKEAASVMKRMRRGQGGTEESAVVEGMREFVELCQMRFGAGREGGAVAG